MNAPFDTTYQEFIYKRSYARWMAQEKRREEWHESVGRYRDFFQPRVPQGLQGDFENAIQQIETLQVMPSMRCLWTAGPALERENICGYNCAYTPVERPKDLASIMYVLLCGAGVGVSVERQYITKLDPVPALQETSYPTIVFEDSKMGWAEGFHTFLRQLWVGMIPTWNLSEIRPRGAILKTFGGRASGPEPLNDLLKFCVRLFKARQGQRLTSEDVSDIVCKTASIVVSGGTRRSAVILLTNPSDRRMASFKMGDFWNTNPHRAYANISAVYTEKPDAYTFMADYMELMASGTGERGFVNREALTSGLPLRRDRRFEFGLNPCGEIILRPRQFCNLTEVVLRPGDTNATIINKIRDAVLLGCLQSTLTDFGFIGSEWKDNCEEERLLGVSLTGFADLPLGVGQMKAFRGAARYHAERVAQALGIKTPMAITCVKPSGTVSQLVNSGSGIHPRYAPYYIRRVRVASSDPLAKFLIRNKVPHAPEIGDNPLAPTTWVFDFPLASPFGAVLRDGRTARHQLDQWLEIRQNWCEHNPSATIYVKDSEWPTVAGWMYENWAHLGGLTLLPFDGGAYNLAPYEEITKEQYEALAAAMPTLDWTLLSKHESKDYTEGAREFACMGGSCEL